MDSAHLAGKHPVRSEFDGGLIGIKERTEEIEEARVTEDERYVLSFLKPMKEHLGLPCPSRLVIRTSLVLRLMFALKRFRPNPPERASVRRIS